jgi:uncharacterized membrane protein
VLPEGVVKKAGRGGAAAKDEEARAGEVALPSVHVMELWISHVLRWGVLLSAAVILAGAAIFLFRGPAAGDPRSFYDLVHGHYMDRSSLSDTLSGVKRHQGLAVVDLGLMLLILTPVVRVGMTFVLFLAQKDWAFVAITAVVLAVLIAGLSGVGV